MKAKQISYLEKKERPQGKAFKNTKFTEEKAHFEKRHLPESQKETTKTHDNPKLTKVTFDHHNKKTFKESGLE